MFCLHGGGTPGHATCFTLPALHSSACLAELADVAASHLPIVWTLAVFTRALWLNLPCLIPLLTLLSLDGFCRFSINRDRRAYRIEALGRERRIPCNQFVR